MALIQYTHTYQHKLLLNATKDFFCCVPLLDHGPALYAGPYADESVSRPCI